MITKDSRMKIIETSDFLFVAILQAWAYKTLSTSCSTFQNLRLGHKMDTPFGRSRPSPRVLTPVRLRQERTMMLGGKSEQKTLPKSSFGMPTFGPY